MKLFVLFNQVRKFLARLAKHRNEPPAWQRAEGLTDERRVYLQKIILDRREANPVRCDIIRLYLNRRVKTVGAIRRHDTKIEGYTTDLAFFPITLV